MTTPNTPAPPVNTEEAIDWQTIAAIFHETYERLAPQFNYKTRPESAVAWEMVSETNRRLMTATIAEIMPTLLAEQKRRDLEEFREMVERACPKHLTRDYSPVDMIRDALRHEIDAKLKELT